jgi:hypothetical protein
VPFTSPFVQRRDYGVLAGGVLVFSVVVFVSFLVAVDVSLHPTNATLITQAVSRIAVSFFIDASL